MKSIKLKKNNYIIRGKISIGGSKSESNRLLVSKAIFPYNIYKIGNLSESEDSQILISIVLNNNWLINVGHAGTVMRFFTAYCTIQNGKMFIIMGSKRMHERPIEILIKALTFLGIEIDYLINNKYPPIKIYGKIIKGGILYIDSNISSQYISALLIISSTFIQGVNIELSKKIISEPYISMTISLLRNIGIYIIWKNKKISIIPKYRKLFIKKFYSESDWTSASYYYAVASLSERTKIYLKKFNNKKSIQGDRSVINIYNHYLGVKTFFKKKGFLLKKKPLPILNGYLEFDLNKCPDIAQTIAVTCTALKIKCLLIGLETLKIKETDRLKSMLIELEKIGACIKCNKYSLIINHFKYFTRDLIEIDTYQDHRMAMAFSIIALYRQILINEYDVIKKSYPKFWIDFRNLGFSIKKI